MIFWSKWVILSVLNLILLGITYDYLRRKIYESRLKAGSIAIGIFVVLGISAFLLTRRYGVNSFCLTQIFLIYILLILTCHDLKDKLLPVQWLIFGGIMGGGFLFYNPNIPILEGIFCPIVFGGLLTGVSKVTKGGVGMGDAYVFAVICLMVGWKLTAAILLFALLLSGFIGIMLFMFKKVNRKTTVPFMPFVMIVTLLMVWI